ncbi:MAG: 4-hydroxyphenylacetate decarboxylase small subunit [Bacteroidales bacterium]|nr:4-hydroxyphenylacetate decarboxylase small subunit [Bacteroidales bacterium]
MELSCKDCRYFLPVDVFRGICKINKEKISPDDAFCEKVEKISKCKFCQYYTSESNSLGKCMGHTLCYPDLVAAKCADFKWEIQK